MELMANALNKSIQGLNKKSSFAMDIESGRLESDLELLSEVMCLVSSWLIAQQP